jgi:hypothetical protein
LEANKNSNNWFSLEDGAKMPSSAAQYRVNEVTFICDAGMRAEIEHGRMAGACVHGWCMRAWLVHACMAGACVLLATGSLQGQHAKIVHGWHQT